jgi:3-deoxy-D-manno-octulosonic-acid transferase
MTEIKERLGLYPGSLTGDKKIWIHCASVGEVNILKSFLKFLFMKTSPDNIVITTMTVTGRENAKSKYNEIKNIFLAPIDIGFSVKNALRRIKPEVMFIIETELWPGLLYFSSSCDTKLVLVNARLSNNAFRWYRFLKFFFRPLLKKFDLIIAQSEDDRKKFIQLKGEDTNIFVSGNLKFDIDTTSQQEKIDAKLIEIFSEKTVFIAGSTHEKEEEIIIKQIPEYLRLFPELKFILAPRHLERLNSIDKLLREYNIRFIKRTQVDSNSDSSFDVLLLDTIGELSSLYQIATIVFIGGTLVPVGGHNVIEPAISGKPVIFGPYYNNFKYACELLLKKGGGICVRDKDELFTKTMELLKDKKTLTDIGKKAKEAVYEGMGSAKKTFELINKIL